jgi:cyclohexanecarboxylate-CoA ligase
LAPTFGSPRAGEYRAAGGPWDQPSLDALLTDAAADASDRVLVVDGDIRVTGAELLERVDAAAAMLVGRGVASGDAAAWQLPNCVEAIVAMRACWRIGAIAAPLHAAFTESEVERAVVRIGPKLVLTADDLAFPVRRLTPIIEVKRRTGEEQQRGEGLAALLFTSGSSGRPKGVLHTSDTLAYKACGMAAVHGLTRDDVVLMPAPLAHVSGLLNGVTASGTVPFKTVLMRRWNPDAALDLIEREGVTFMVGPPTFFVSLMRAPGFTSERVASLRLVSSGGAGVSDAFVAEASERLGCVVKRTYGSTEAPSVATAANGVVDDAPRALAPCELLVDERGELLVRGPEVCVGYLDDDDTRRAFDSNGWYRTGDLASIDADGRLAILGRVDDVIIRGGENIAATEVEGVLERHPHVRQCAVVGVADDLMGERACAFVVTDTDVDFDVDECVRWCAAEGLARYKTPEHLFVIDALPVLASGKPDRAESRALAAASVSRS